MIQPLISVIVPVYNSSAFLDRCISSVINQTYNNLEIIIIDDGSCDDSLNICNKYAEIDKRIIVVHQDNRGVSAARNLALNICKGAFVTFVDSDDWVAENYIFELYTLIDKTNADVSACYIQKTNNRINKCDKRVKIHRKQVFLTSGAESLFRIIENDSAHSLCACGKMFKVCSDFKKIYFDTNVSLGEDQLFLIDIYQCSQLIALCNLPLYFYYQNTNSATHRDYISIDIKEKVTSSMERILHEKFPEKKDEITSLALKRNMDYYLNDYYSACLRHDRNSADRFADFYSSDRTIYMSLGNKLKLKFRIFDFSKFLFVCAMYLFQLINIKGL